MKTETEYEKLEPEFKAKWIAALRSGDYKQGHQVLYRGGEHDTYCCLGVACVVAGVAASQISGCSFINTDTDAVPSQLKGLTRTNTLPGVLSEMNDDGKPFREIANWIEENL